MSVGIVVVRLSVRVARPCSPSGAVVGCFSGPATFPSETAAVQVSIVVCDSIGGLKDLRDGHEEQEEADDNGNEDDPSYPVIPCASVPAITRSIRPVTATHDLAFDAKIEM